jgi:signal transduction histidine kinase
MDGVSQTAIARAPRFHGLSLLPELFADPPDSGPVAPLGASKWLQMAAALMPPLVLTLLLGYDTEYSPHANHGVHRLVEGFCALMSLVVFYVLHQEFLSTGTTALRMMAFAFLVLGVLDAGHALSPPHSGVFVWLRTCAALGSATLLALSLRHHGRDRSTAAVLPGNVAVDAWTVAAASLLFVALSFLLQDWLPPMLQGENFSPATLVLKVLAGLLYAWAGRGFLRYYCRSRETILFVLALAMFLFAESQLLSFFSEPWDVVWWAWHWTRTAVFIGILFGMALEFTRNAKDLQVSQVHLMESERLASLGEMAAGIAHEIRNPLATLTGSVSLLKDEKVSGEERRELIDIMEKEINRLTHVVSDTLAFAHTLPDRLRILNLETVVREAIGAPASRHGGVHVTLEFAADIPLVRGDEIKLQRVVWNLFDNAVAAMSGKGTFQVSARRENGQVALSFRDSGEGMSPETLGQVFKPFFTTREDGVGLGLAIVQRMVLEHHGSIEISSTLGEGTIVTVRLPGV